MFSIKTQKAQIIFIEVAAIMKWHPRETAWDSIIENVEEIRLMKCDGEFVELSIVCWPFNAQHICHRRVKSSGVSKSKYIFHRRSDVGLTWAYCRHLLKNRSSCCDEVWGLATKCHSFAAWRYWHTKMTIWRFCSLRRKLQSTKSQLCTCPLQLSLKATLKRKSHLRSDRISEFCILALLTTEREKWKSTTIVMCEGV